MVKILVSGLINIETTLRVDSFPVYYNPVNYPFFGVNSSVSGVGYNIAKALTILGDEVRFVSIVGRDLAAAQVRATLAQDGISGRFILEQVEATAQSVILYDPAGRREIFVDLKDIQDQAYPPDYFEEALEGCDLAVLCNINFSRPFLQKARQAGIPVATDVHVLSRLDDEYNTGFMRAADILFMSDEGLPTGPEAWAAQVRGCCDPQVLVIGLGAQGALLSTRSETRRFPAVTVRPVVNTIGAGDALFSAFLHAYAAGAEPGEALRKAILFAAHKIGARSAAGGFLDHAGLEQLSHQFS